MPLTLNVGLSKKVGLPDYGSLGASCHVEVELDGSLLQSDPDAFRQRARDAFAVCREAVQDELARNQTGKPNGVAAAAQSNGKVTTNGNGSGHNGSGQPRRATASQVRAILAIANR